MATATLNRRFRMATVLILCLLCQPVFSQQNTVPGERNADLSRGVDASPADGFDTDRVPLLTVVPDYPRKAKRGRIEGDVQVCFNIDRAGKTLRVTVRNSTHRIFEKPSIKAVRNSTYRPLPKDAVVPGIKSCRTFRFFLEPVAIDKLDGPDETSE